MPSTVPTDEDAGNRTDAAALSADFPFVRKFVSVNGARMSYVEAGEGRPVLFVHGNPTSSYVWRNVIPYAAATHRAIAVDLIGMGASDKPDIAYRLDDHAVYLDGFIRALGLKEIVLVLHDWGTALGMRYARLHEENVRGLAFMEAVIPPASPVPDYAAMGPVGELFRNLRTPGIGEAMVLEQNMFIEQLLPMGVVRQLTSEEMARYREPFPTAESRRPILQWAREIPIGGEPADSTQTVLRNGAWLNATPLPKLYFYGDPGASNPAPVVEALKATLPNLESRPVGSGLHFLQEDQPETIGRALADWLGRI